MNWDNTPVTNVADVAIGRVDSRGFPITDVYWKTKDYAVFRVRGRVSPMFSDNPADSEIQRQNYMQLGGALARINTLEPGRIGEFLDRFWSIVQRERESSPSPAGREYLDREIARAIVMSLEGMLEAARANLALLEEKIITLKQTERRISYISVCVFAAAIYLGLVLWFVESDGCNAHPNPCGTIRNYIAAHDPMFRATAVAVLAGLLSVSIRLRDLQPDVDSQWAFTVVYGCVRLLISVIAALFVYVAIESGIVFAAIELDLSEAGSSDRAVLYVMAFLAGFSESFVPNVLNRVEKEQTKGKS